MVFIKPNKSINLMRNKPGFVLAMVIVRAGYANRYARELTIGGHK